MAAATYKGIPVGAVPGLHQRGLDFLQSYVSPPGRVLDLGTGAGAFMQRLLDAGFEVVGVDKREEGFRASGAFVRCDLNAPFAGLLAGARPYHAIVAVEVVEHLENPRHLFRECAALLEPGGVFLVTTPYIESAFSRVKFLVTGRFEWFEEAHYSSSGHLTPVTQWQLRQVAEETGFLFAETRRGPRPVVSLGRLATAVALSFLMRDTGWEEIRLSVFRRAVH
jgi:cyclopropane fatty-acyl-phospholipid synthase-like methyltransferase